MKYYVHLLLAAAVTLTAGCARRPGPSLETVKVEKGELSETVTATGTIESVTQVDVGTQVTGIIDKLYADYNSVVSKGQLIAEIEKTLLQSDLASAEANVESARLPRRPTTRPRPTRSEPQRISTMPKYIRLSTAS